MGADQEQYQYYNPDWTICGGTGDLFTHVTWDNQIAWETTTRGVRWFMREANKYVVAFAHPEVRVDDSLLVYGLLDAIREIIQSSLSDL